MNIFKEIHPEMLSVLQRCDFCCVTSAEVNCELGAKIKSKT